MGRKDKADGWWWEHDHNVPKGRTGRAGKAPRGREDSGTNPRGFGRSLFRAGPTRGSSSTGHDRRGGWFFGRGR